MTDETVVEAAPMAEIQSPKEIRPSGLFGSSSPVEVLDRAKKVAQALAAELDPSDGRRPLFKEISGRRHVLVEGWTMLGTLLGVFPVEVWTRQIPDSAGEWAPPKTERQVRSFPSKFGAGTYDREVDVVVEPGRGGWEARVEARTLDGRVVGAAEAECRWDESSWSNRDSYALRSMAQTRATSKALRMPLGFVVTLAGFESTPAEEIPEAPAESAGGLSCPACRSGVFDNRAENVERAAKKQKSRPAFKCRNRDCDGVSVETGEVVTDGTVGEPWISWSATFFDRDSRPLSEVVDGLTSDDEIRAAARRWLFTRADGSRDLAGRAFEIAGGERGVDYPIGELLEIVELAGGDALAEARAELDTAPYQYS